ncbi:metallophosphoesterase family protein [Candidatus Poribacteria bacterium]|nr:metallophosphoesterase family protein [Candidatus Poribacteria bacterium]
MATHRFGLISDTHGSLHPSVFTIFAGVEAIFHAGDVVGEHLLDELETIAPAFAVHGNCDVASPRLPAHQILDTPFGRAVLTHSHLIAGGMGHPKLLARHFAAQNPRLVVFGHTHKPYQALHDGVWVVNPGPAGKPRFRAEPSVVVLTWDSDRLTFTFQSYGLDWNRVRKP